ncbi:endonuclease III [Candidatus Poribacteria bacterium]|nr:endonuclease III [Candidatus Poribacteria bacterium]
MAVDRLCQSTVPAILDRLDAAYGEPACALVHDSPYQLLSATILSAQCTDKTVNTVTPALFARYPTVHDLAQADLAELERIIFRTGFYRNKAKHLKGMAQRVVETYGGNIPSTLDELLTLPGVARKTAHVLLNVWYGQASGIVVDTHVARISRLLALSDGRTPDKVADDLEAIIPRDRWIRLTLQLIEHGRRVCIARRPDCGQCALRDLCPSAQE